MKNKSSNVLPLIDASSLSSASSTCYVDDKLMNNKNLKTYKNVHDSQTSINQIINTPLNQRKIGSIYDYDPEQRLVSGDNSASTSHLNDIYYQPLQQKQANSFNSTTNLLHNLNYSQFSDQFTNKYQIYSNKIMQNTRDDFYNEMNDFPTSSSNSTTATTTPNYTNNNTIRYFQDDFGSSNNKYKAVETGVYKAIYDYDATESDELTFRDGDKFINCEYITTGWMVGVHVNSGKHGMIPSNYCIAEPIDYF